MTRRNVVFLTAMAVMVGCLPDYPADRLDGPPYGKDLSSGSNAPGGTEESSSGGSGSAITGGTQPEFGATVRQADPPPPLSGGTLAVASDGFTVVAADPDRDRVYVIDIRGPGTVKTIALLPHDEPGRVAIDGARRAHVALRNGGAIVSIDLASASVIARREACSAPRGIAYDPVTDRVHVACTGGELITFSAAGGVALQKRMMAFDLRDVVVLPGGLALTTFREARILRLANNTDIPVEQLAASSRDFGEPRVAWRMISAPSPHGAEDDILVTGQKVPDPGDPNPPAAPPPYYDNSGSCSTIGPAPVILDRAESIQVPEAVLPVDVAATKNLMVIAAAGNAHTSSLPQLVFVSRLTPVSPGHVFSCSQGAGTVLGGVQITSVAFAQNDHVVVALSREPAALVVVDSSSRAEISRIALSAESREDTGHAIFHSNSGAGVACASCHPDGREDGYSWRSVDLGARRTPSLLGTLANTAPYHWNGEAKDMGALMELTFESRMRGPILASDRIDAIGGWLDALRAPPAVPASDPASAARGKALFEGAANCAGCHGGAMRTNNSSTNVQTGGVFQVPSLIGAPWRAPYFHDGSAPTVTAVLERGHGGAALEAQDRLDLAAFVGTF